MKLSAACCFSNKVQVIEHYHNSSWLEHGGAPEKATKSAFVSAVDKYLRDQNKYQKNESKITWQDIEDCLIFVSNNFSTQTSYENQTKKSITDKFVQEAMTEFLRTDVYKRQIPDAAEIAVGAGAEAGVFLKLPIFQVIDVYKRQGLLCCLLLFQLAFPAKAAGSVYFVAAEESVLPVSYTHLVPFLLCKSVAK